MNSPQTSLLLEKIDSPADLRESMWPAVYEIFKTISKLGDSWNDLAYDITENG